MKENHYKIEEVAIKTGLTKRCLRYYEDVGLVVPKRTSCSYRLYTDEDIENIERIKDLKDSLGFSLKEVKNFLLLRTSIIDMFAANNTSDAEMYIDRLKVQIEFINEKEKSLERVKKRCYEVLEELEDFKRNRSNRRR
ncbi:MAG: MerR family transcriptional regulator [Clostridium tyrobutyricum]|jgi:DNA-binding transcriptional MerR regulator|uniref:MerR family transcriptional regulator n=1 Tax=Clostridium tyrobutyricum TaxID=1519 RepID=UPI00243267DD|nr:MerR family transcriptional regulator [Clostridium tyrobutyricum]MCH4199701.1 MerR family transcriptional regulator [Clostridium tyrobutyricum]MCH4236439.1 MerR family transcriptional regulator [Clostridium tyrobutyricum]MCH4258240.1 MerR family transcriptional regulator [Clostridium tyrobutyricum]MCI1239409.1 MerR family transcriptional regulator [Clostridium tyrobutyricum]MCI1653122.1 MerR family transcriptional regulator [Clostridium tyrobutyricum]